MGRLAVLSFLASIASLSIAASCVAQNSPQRVSDCQVGVKAALDLRAIGTPAPIGQQAAPTPSVRLQLALTNRQSVPVIGMDLIAYAYPLVGNVASPPQKTVNVRLRIAPNGRNYTELKVDGISTVGLIEVATVVYADGSIWHPASPKSCRITPAAASMI